MIVYHLICRLVRVSKQQRSTEIKQNTPHRLRKSAESRPRIPGKVSRNKKQLSFFVYCCTWHFVMSFQGVAAQGFSLEKMQNVVKTQDQALIISYANDKAENGSNLQLNAKRGVEMLEVDEQTGAENNKSNLTPEVDEQTGAENNKSNLTVEVDEQAGAENNKSNLTPEVDEQTGAENKSNLTPEVDEQAGAENNKSNLTFEVDEQAGAENNKSNLTVEVDEQANTSLKEQKLSTLDHFVHLQQTLDSPSSLVLQVETNNDVHLVCAETNGSENFGNIKKLRLPDKCIVASKDAFEELKRCFQNVINAIESPNIGAGDNKPNQEQVQECRSAMDSFCQEMSLPLVFDVVELNSEQKGRYGQKLQGTFHSLGNLNDLQTELEKQLKDNQTYLETQDRESKESIASAEQQLEQKQKELQETISQIECATSSLKQLGIDIQQKERLVSELKKEIDHCSAEQKKQSQLLNTMIELQSHPVTREKISASNTKLLLLGSSYCANVESMRTISNEMKTEIETLNAKKTELDNVAQSLEEQKSAFKKVENDVQREMQTLNNLTFQTNTFKRFTEEKKQEQSDLDAQILKLKSDLQTNETTKNRLENEVTALQKKLDDLQQTEKSVTSQIENKRAGKAALLKEYNGLSKDVMDKKSEVSELTIQIKNAKTTFDMWERARLTKQTEYDDTVIRLDKYTKPAAKREESRVSSNRNRSLHASPVDKDTKPPFRRADSHASSNSNRSSLTASPVDKDTRPPFRRADSHASSNSNRSLTASPVICSTPNSQQSESTAKRSLDDAFGNEYKQRPYKKTNRNAFDSVSKLLVNSSSASSMGDSSFATPMKHPPAKPTEKDFRACVRNLFNKVSSSDGNTSFEATDDERGETDDIQEAFSKEDVLHDSKLPEQLCFIVQLGTEFFQKITYRKNNYKAMCKKLFDAKLDVVSESPVRLFEALSVELKLKPSEIRDQLNDFISGEADMFYVSIISSQLHLSLYF